LQVIFDKPALSQYFANTTRRVPICFLNSSQHWIVGGYIDGLVRFINPFTGKDEQSFSPTGDIVTAVASKGRYLFLGTEYGHILGWTIEPSGLLSLSFKFQGQIDGVILSLEVVPKTPLLIATSASGFAVLINYESGTIEQMYEYQKALYPIERVEILLQGCCFSGFSFMHLTLLTSGSDDPLSLFE
jgi:WD40 repeat protein